jgi:hypothetical protein
MMKSHSTKIAALCAATFALLPAASATATSFPVTNTGNSGAGSLRQAITDANGNAGLDQIPISATGTIQLASALPDISGQTQISGPGAASLTVRRNVLTAFPIFTIGAGSVDISGLTISNGDSSTGGGIATTVGTATTLTNVVVTGNSSGGGIGGRGALTLNGTTVSGNTSGGAGGGIGGSDDATLINSTVSGNTASGGGGISTPAASLLSLTDSTVTGNDASVGAGIATSKLSTLTLTRVTVSDNDAVAAGGGLSINGSATITDSDINGDNDAGTNGGGITVSVFGDVDLVDSSVSDNDAVGNGGGIDNQGDEDLTLSGTTVDANQSGGVGGGILHQTGDLTVSNSTFAGNQADGSGGGIATVSGTTSINSATIVGNAADVDGVNGDLGGGGIAEEGPGTPVVSNTLIASNTVGQSQPATQCYGDYFSGGFNLRSIDDTGCSGFTATGDIVNGTPLLGSLGNQGGPTLTVPLLSGSPAIDAGNTAALSNTPPACPATDQRGQPRGGGAGRCDIGAFEVQPPVTPPAGGGSTQPAPTPKKHCKKGQKLKKGKCLKRKKGKK